MDEDLEPEIGGELPEEQRIESKEEFWSDITKEARSGRLRIKSCVCCLTFCQGPIVILPLIAGIWSAFLKDGFIPGFSFLTVLIYSGNACHGWWTSICGFRCCFSCFYYSHYCVTCYALVMCLLCVTSILLCVEPGDHLDSWAMCKAYCLPQVIDLFASVSAICIAPPVVLCSNEFRKYLNLAKNRKRLAKKAAKKEKANMASM